MWSLAWLEQRQHAVTRRLQGLDPLDDTARAQFRARCFATVLRVLGLCWPRLRSCVYLELLLCLFPCPSLLLTLLAIILVFLISTLPPKHLLDGDLLLLLLLLLCVPVFSLIPPPPPPLPVAPLLGCWIWLPTSLVPFPF